VNPEMEWFIDLVDNGVAYFLFGVIVRDYSLHALGVCYDGPRLRGCLWIGKF